MSAIAQGPPRQDVSYPFSSSDTTGEIGTIYPQFLTPVATLTHPSTVVAQNERGRSRKKKKCQRESSSSSEESLERESSHWRGYTQRDRSRSPQPPKMPVFTGKSDLSWESFIYQFERTASRRNWDETKKACRLLDCLSDVELEYAHRVSTREGYGTLRKLLKRRFSKKEEASSARRQLQFVRQGDTESL